MVSVVTISTRSLLCSMCYSTQVGDTRYSDVTNFFEELTQVPDEVNSQERPTITYQSRQ